MKLLQIKVAEATQFSVFARQEYFQNARYRWHGHHGPRYHIYLLPASCDLKGEVKVTCSVIFFALRRAAASKEKQDRHYAVSN